LVNRQKFRQPSTKALKKAWGGADLINSDSIPFALANATALVYASQSDTVFLEYWEVNFFGSGESVEELSSTSPEKYMWQGVENDHLDLKQQGGKYQAYFVAVLELGCLLQRPDYLLGFHMLDYLPESLTESE
jgi:hypothetical protein